MTLVQWLGRSPKRRETPVQLLLLIRCGRGDLTWVSQILGEIPNRWVKGYKVGSRLLSPLLDVYVESGVPHPGLARNGISTWLLERGSQLWIASQDRLPPLGWTEVPNFQRGAGGLAGSREQLVAHTPLAGIFCCVPSVTIYLAY